MVEEIVEERLEQFATPLVSEPGKCSKGETTRDSSHFHTYFQVLRT